MFSAHCSGCFWCGKTPGFCFPPLQVHRGAQVLSYFWTQSSEVCAATELAEERRSFAFRRASLSYFTLILSDSHAVGFIVRSAFLELLHQAFSLRESREARMRRQKCRGFIFPRELCRARAWSVPALLSSWAVSDEPGERTELPARSWAAMPGRRVELQFLLLSGEWGKHLPQC